MISPPCDSLSSRTGSASSPSSNVELFQSTLVKVRNTRYFVTMFIKPAPRSSSAVWSGPGLGESLLLTRLAAARPRPHAAHDAVSGHEQIVMIFSCSDRSQAIISASRSRGHRTNVQKAAAIGRRHSEDEVEVRPRQSVSSRRPLAVHPQGR